MPIKLRLICGKFSKLFIMLGFFCFAAGGAQASTLKAGSLDSSFGSGGYVIPMAAPGKIAADDQFIYVLGQRGEEKKVITMGAAYSYTEYQAVIEKRLLSAGSLDPGFGDNGVLITPDNFHEITLDQDYMYLAGEYDTEEKAGQRIYHNSHWRIQKRLLTTGELDFRFGIGGIIDSGIDSNAIYDIAIDRDFIYIVGDSFKNVVFSERGAGGQGGTDGEWRIEKRLLSTGELDQKFGDNGVIIGETRSHTANAIAIDSNYLYIVGDGTKAEAYSGMAANAPADDLLYRQRIEKRLLSTGALDQNFGTGGVWDEKASASGVSADYTNDIAIDFGHMYLVGGYTNRDGKNDIWGWRAEKRSLADAAIDKNFGKAGVVTVSSPRGYGAEEIVLDSNYMYITSGGATAVGVIEKRSLSNGALDTGFGDNGLILGGYGIDKIIPAHIAIAGDAIYLGDASSHISEGKVIQKRVILDKEAANLPAASSTDVVNGKSKAKLTKNLFFGMKNDPEIKILQQWLASDGVYPEAVFSDYFGPLTRAAVIRFQEKYALEILVPGGFAKGTGFAGPATRDKLNKLYGK